jgi:hypothetical protein
MIRLQAVLPTHSSLNLQADILEGGGVSGNRYTDGDVGTREGRKVRGPTRVMDWHYVALQTCAVPHRLCTLVFPIAQVVPVNSVFNYIFSDFCGYSQLEILEQ